MKEAGRREGSTHLNEMHACHAVCEGKGNEDALHFAEFRVVDGLPWYMFRTRASVRCSGRSAGCNTVICHYRCCWHRRIDKTKKEALDFDTAVEELPQYGGYKVREDQTLGGMRSVSMSCACARWSMVGLTSSLNDF